MNGSVGGSLTFWDISQVALIYGPEMKWSKLGLFHTL